MAVVVTLAGVLHALDAVIGNASDYRTRRMAADVGRWIGHEFPARPMVAGPIGITPIVSFYAQQSPYCVFRWEADDTTILSTVDLNKAGIVLLRPTKQLSAERCRELAQRLEQRRPAAGRRGNLAGRRGRHANPGARPRKPARGAARTLTSGLTKGTDKGD